MNVNIKDHYPNADYDLYLTRSGNKTKAPKKVTYKPGDVVYNTVHNTIGIVLGCICESLQELRTDADGMVCYQDIRPYEMLDELKSRVGIKNTLRESMPSNDIIEEIRSQVEEELEFNLKLELDKLVDEYDEDDRLQDTFAESDVKYTDAQNLAIREYIVFNTYLSLS